MKLNKNSTTPVHYPVVHSDAATPGTGNSEAVFTLNGQCDFAGESSLLRQQRSEKLPNTRRARASDTEWNLGDTKYTNTR